MRAAVLGAALTVVACSGSSKLERGGGSSNGGDSGMGGPTTLPPPDAVDLAAPASPGEPLLLARGQLGPIALALDAENVYWQNRGTFESSLKDKYSNGDASVMKCARTGCGGRPTPLATNRTFQSQGTLAFALDGHYVYFNDWSEASGEAALVRCAVGGCNLSPEPVLSRAVHALGADAARLYATEYQAEVFTCGTADCEGSVMDLWSAGYTPIATDVAADASGVYWTTAVLDGVLACPATGCDNSPRVVMPSNSGLTGATELAKDADNVYATDSNACTAGMLVACKKTGCPEGARLLADQLNEPTSIVTDGAHLYFAEQAASACGKDSASIRRCAVNGCDDSPETLALGVVAPSAVAVDAEYVFVADVEAGTVWRLPKPPARR